MLRTFGESGNHFPDLVSYTSSFSCLSTLPCNVSECTDILISFVKEDRLTSMASKYAVLENDSRKNTKIGSVIHLRVLRSQNPIRSDLATLKIRYYLLASSYLSTLQASYIWLNDQKRFAWCLLLSFSIKVFDLTMGDFPNLCRLIKEMSRPSDRSSWTLTSVVTAEHLGFCNILFYYLSTLNSFPASQSYTVFSVSWESKLSYSRTTWRRMLVLSYFTRQFLTFRWRKPNS